MNSYRTLLVTMQRTQISCLYFRIQKYFCVHNSDWKNWTSSIILCGHHSNFSQVVWMPVWLLDPYQIFDAELMLREGYYTAGVRWYFFLIAIFFCPCYLLTAHAIAKQRKLSKRGRMGSSNVSVSLPEWHGMWAVVGCPWTRQGSGEVWANWCQLPESTCLMAWLIWGQSSILPRTHKGNNV